MHGIDQYKGQINKLIRGNVFIWIRNIQYCEYILAAYTWFLIFCCVFENVHRLFVGNTFNSSFDSLTRACVLVLCTQMGNPSSTYMYPVQPILALRPFYGTYTNSADPDQTSQNGASDQCLQCLLKEYYIKNWIKIPPDNPKIGNELVQLIKMGKSIWHKLVK